MTTKLLTIIIGITATLCLHSQTSQKTTYILDKNYFKSKGAEFVPTGSYTDASGKIISVQSFFMTNEITNKEYREFVDFVVSHPDSSLYYIDFKKDGSFFKNRIPFSQIRYSLIDTLDAKRKDYFTNKKYDDFPVMGVSWDGARYYCIWKTVQENEALKKNGKGLINDFRVPTKEEFEYAKSFSPNFPKKNGTEIGKSKSGKADKLGLYNLFDNADEWLSSWDPEKKLVKSSTVENTSAQIGFRMVSTFLGK